MKAVLKVLNAVMLTTVALTTVSAMAHAGSRCSAGTVWEILQSDDITVMPESLPVGMTVTIQGVQELDDRKIQLARFSPAYAGETSTAKVDLSHRLQNIEVTVQNSDCEWYTGPVSVRIGANLGTSRAAICTIKARTRGASRCQQTGSLL